LYFGWPEGPANRTTLRPLSSNVIFFILVGILGWRVFGPAIHG
jgi:hypothetical protein